VKILTRRCTSLDGYVTTQEGKPVQLAFDGWDAGALGVYELQSQCDAVPMGRTTFEPALAAPHWPWGDLAVFVLGRQQPEGTPDHVVVDEDPVRLLERLRQADRGGDVHLVGGPRMVETVRRLDALDELRAHPGRAGPGRTSSRCSQHQHAGTSPSTPSEPVSVASVDVQVVEQRWQCQTTSEGTVGGAPSSSTALRCRIRSRRR
jgi:dihydrofolate reductase